MAGVAENTFSTLSLGSRASEKTVQSTGGRDSILKAKAEGGAALSSILKAPSSQGISESGKGGKVSVTS